MEMRNFLLKLLINVIERDLNIVKENLTEEQRNGLLAMLWDNASFRNYIADRNAKLVYSIAGIAGQEPEPRDKARLWMGQRVEILLLASKCKAAAERRNKALAEKKNVAGK